MSKFSLKEPLGTNYRSDSNDIMNTKRALNTLGYYDVPPDRGIDDWTDDAMFQGIRTFQRDNALKVDGFMRPEARWRPFPHRLLAMPVEIASEGLPKVAHMIKKGANFFLCVAEEAPKPDIIGLVANATPGENRFLDRVRRLNAPFFPWQRKKKAARYDRPIGIGIEHLAADHNAGRDVGRELVFREIVGMHGDITEHRHRLLAREHQRAFSPFMRTNSPRNVGFHQDSPH